MKGLRCPFCEQREQMGNGIPLCNVCAQALDNKQIPPIQFLRYFSSDLEKKLKDMDILIGAYPNDFFPWYLRGHIEHELGDTKKALRSLNSTLNFNPKFGDAWIRLGLLYSDLHREDDSLDNFRKGLSLPLVDPTNLIEAGISLLASGNSLLSAQLLERARELVPNDDRVLVSLGKAYAQVGKTAEARETFEKSLQLFPHNEEVIRGMAQMLLRSGDLEASMEMYSRILDQHPTDFEAMLAMGELHLRKGELAQALKFYKEVRELDVHISWSGILRFIITHLRQTVSLNQNMESYKDDLRKEYDTILAYMKELEEKAPAATGPELMDDIESLIKVIDGQKHSLKDHLRHFEEFLKRYDARDPFQKHLREKVAEFKSYVEAGRYFDAKDASGELMPFLSEVRSADSKTFERMKASIIKKLDDLEEIGLERRDLFKKLESALKLEKEKNAEGALLVLKEIEIAIEQHWQTAGKDYHDRVMGEMEGLLQKGKGQFDTTGLTRLYESYTNLFKKGPLAVRDAQKEFTRRYEEDASAYFVRESERLLREAQYKIVIMEKEGTDVSSLKASMKKVKAMMEGRSPPLMTFRETQGFVGSVNLLEGRHKAGHIRERLLSVDNLVGQLELLGIENEISENVSPVRKVIERAIKADNMKLAEILINEVTDNVEKLLWEHYIGGIRKALEDAGAEVQKLRGFGVERPEWGELLKNVASILSEGGKGPQVLEAVAGLAKVQVGIQEFYMEKLPVEIDFRIDRCRAYLSEADDFGIELGPESERFVKLIEHAEKFSTLDILEVAYRLERELDSRILSELSTRTGARTASLRAKVDGFAAKGVPQGDMMEAISLINRTEVLLEHGDPKEATKTLSLAEKALRSLERRNIQELIRTREREIGTLEMVCRGMGIDLEEPPSETLALLKITNEPEAVLDRAEDMLESTRTLLTENVAGALDSLQMEFREVQSRGGQYITDGELRAFETGMEALKGTLKDRHFEVLPELLGNVREMIDHLGRTIRERELLERCSVVMDRLSPVDDEGAEVLRRSVREAVQRIRRGDIEGLEETLSAIRKEAEGLRGSYDQRNYDLIEEDLRELSDLGREVFAAIDGPDIGAEKASLSADLSSLLEEALPPSGRPDGSKLKELSNRAAVLREKIISIENRWRARKRLKTLEEVVSQKGSSKSPSLQGDLDNLKELYGSGDFTRFFRTWETVEAKLNKTQVNLIKREITDKEDKVMQVLVRAKAPRRTELKDQERGKTRGFGGIKKLAQDMAEKRKMLDSFSAEDRGAVEEPAPEEPARDAEVIVPEKIPVPEPVPALPVVEDQVPSIELPAPTPTPRKAPLPETRPAMEERDLSGLAKLIANSRIEELRSGPAGPEVTFESKASVWKEEFASSKESKDDLQKAMLSCMMEEFLELEDKSPSNLVGSDVQRLKDKLELFFKKMPPKLRADEAKAYYKKGMGLLQSDDLPGAHRELKLAISSAIRIGRLHTDLSKALRTARGTLDSIMNRDEVYIRAEKLYAKAEYALGNGNLEDCARLIKAIRNTLSGPSDEKAETA